MNIKRFLRQYAVYWAPLGVDDNGNQTYDDPVEIKCRWEDKQQVFTSATGQEKVSKSIVYTDVSLLPDGVLWLGTLNQLDEVYSPFENRDASAIQAAHRIPDRKAKKFLIIGFL